MNNYKNIDEYIAQFPGEIKEKLEKIRLTIRTVAPGAEELASYGMPAYKVNKRILIYFAAMYYGFTFSSIRYISTQPSLYHHPWYNHLTQKELHS